MHETSTLFTSLFWIVSHLPLNRRVSKFLHQSNNISGFPLYLGALSMTSCILSSIIASTYVSWVAFPVPLSPVDVPCLVVIHPSYSAPTLLSVSQSFSMFSTLFLTLQLHLFHSLHQDFQFHVLKVSTLSSGFLHIWSSDILCFTFWYSVGSGSTPNLLLHCHCFFRHSFSYY